MKKRYFFVGGILLLLIIGWGFYKYNKPHASTANQKTDFAISAVDLYNSFQKDESAANHQFLGKVIEVRGTISVMQTSAGNTNILMDASPAGGVNCSFTNAGSQTFRKLKKGDAISIKGRCSGFLMDVNLVDCVIVN